MAGSSTHRWWFPVQCVAFPIRKLTDSRALSETQDIRCLSANGILGKMTDGLIQYKRASYIELHHRRLHCFTRLETICHFYGRHALRKKNLGLVTQTCLIYAGAKARHRVPSFLPWTAITSTFETGDSQQVSNKNTIKNMITNRMPRCHLLSWVESGRAWKVIVKHWKSARMFLMHNI